MKGQEPAFPTKPLVVSVSDGLGYTTHEVERVGLTKREYVAIAAMRGLMARTSWGNYSSMATEAVEAADALLVQLEKGETR